MKEIRELEKEFYKMLETYKRYDAELMYFEVQYNFYKNKEMMEHAIMMRSILREEAERAYKSASEAFYYKYEDTDEEELANQVNSEKIAHSVHLEACRIAEEMRRANGINI